MRHKIAVLAMVFSIFFLAPVQAQFGQFGKNKVVYESQKVLFYQSEHVDFYHWQDVKDKSQIKHLAHIVDQVERSYGYLSSYLGHNLSKRPNVVFYRTQSTFAATHILGEHFISENILAFARPTGDLMEEYILAIKLDLSVEEYDATITHEMVHIFQFDVGPSILKRLRGSGPPNWIMEGGAEFIGNEYNGSRSDDLRESDRRGAGANPEKDLPTWFELNEGTADPYTFGEMMLRFIKENYGQKVIKSFLVRAFKDGEDLIDVLVELTNGAIRSPEQLDEAQRDYWREKFGQEMLVKPRPYQEDEYFRGRHVVSAMYPEPVISQVVSPDGKKLAVLTISRKYEAIVLAVIPALPRDISEHVPKPKPDSKSGTSNKENKSLSESWKIEILTPYLSPKHFEYIALGIEVPNLTWVRSGDQEYISFFAQDGKDHKLFIVNLESHRDLRSIEVPFDNALSPVFSPDGTKVYFTASQKNTRDIYELELATNLFKNLTNDESYDESPSVSPDGTQIAYISFWGSFRKIFLLDLNTKIKKQITFNAFNDQAPRFSDDGRMLVYTSDEKSGVSNIYTIDLETNLVSQQTDFFGRAFTPHFARGENDRIYYTHLWQYDQYRSFIGKNWELFEILIKKPYRQYVMHDNAEHNSLVFIPDRDLFEFELDENQLLNQTLAPEKWSCGSGNVSFGVNTYWGMASRGIFGCSNILETKRHVGLFAVSGYLKIVDYSYLNQETRTSWRWGAHYYQMPLRYQFYDIVNKQPRQLVLNHTWIKESSFDFSFAYPSNKFNRWEFFSKLYHHSFNILGVGASNLNEADFRLLPELFTDGDIQMYKFLRSSEGSNLSFGAAYVQDTVLYSYRTGLSGVPAPFHGNVVRLQAEVAPRLGEEFQGFMSANISARTYRHLGSSSLFAGRIDLMTTNRANGEFMLLGGPDKGRGIEYGSLVCNQCAYASGELRFSIPGTYILGQNVRGFLFADMAVAKFSDEKFSIQKLKTYGVGLQYIIPIINWPAQSIWTIDNGKWKPSFYATFNW